MSVRNGAAIRNGRVPRALGVLLALLLALSGCRAAPGPGAGAPAEPPRAVAGDEGDEGVAPGAPPSPPEQPGKPVLVGYASRPTDPFELRTAAVAGDLLVLEVAYAGGCEEHTFEVLTADSFMEGSPVVLGINLFHDARGDACEAWLQRRLWFDLRPVRELYRQVYREPTGSVELRLPHAPDGPLVYRF